MSGHDDQLETTVPGETCNHRRRIARHQPSWTFIWRKIRVKKCIEFLLSNLPEILFNRGERSNTHLETGRAKVKDVKKGNGRQGDGGGTLHEGCHRCTGRREVHWEQNFLDRLHIAPHGAFNCLMAHAPLTLCGE